MADRLGELNQDPEDDDVNDENDTNLETKEHYKQYELIKSSLEMIKANVAEIEKLKEIDRNIANETRRKENMDKLDNCMAKTNNTAQQCKKRLDDLKKQNDIYKKEHPNEFSKSQMRNNLYQTYIRRFHQVMNDYNSAAHEFKQNLQARTRRQLLIVDSTMTNEEADRIVASGQANGVIKQALISENVEDVVRDIEERHMDILKLEQQVLEVYQLFQDLATLVDIQQESLDVIENRIEHAKNYAEKAEEELKQAEVYQKKSKKRCCCIVIILLSILVIILIPIISSVAGSA